MEACEIRGRTSKRNPAGGLLPWVCLMLVIALVQNVVRHGSLLDVLNASIAEQVRFEVFYAGLPGLPACVELYPELARLEDRFSELREEVAPLVALSARVPTMQSTYNLMFLGAVDSESPRDRWYHPIASRLWRLLYGRHLDIFNKIASQRWKTLNLILYDQIVWENAWLCPKLVDVLREMRCVQTALLSFMEPGARVPPHSDPATGVLRYHLAFIVPKDRERCTIRVDGRPYAWTEGESVIFDTVYEHEVHNDTEECRVVLFIDLYRPMRGIPAILQAIANEANRISPGTRAVMRGSGMHAHVQSP